MAWQIIWTERVQKERIEFFTFWNIHNQSSAYSKKLNKLTKQSLKIISKHTRIGKPTNQENVRVKILKNYLIN